MTQPRRTIVIEPHAWTWRRPKVDTDMVDHVVTLGWWTIYIAKERLTEHLAKMKRDLESALATIRVIREKSAQDRDGSSGQP